MAKGFLHGNGGSGGSGFEFTIVGGTNRPTKASHNTVWVNTGKEVTSYSLSATEPANPSEGMVWIKIGNSGFKDTNIALGGEWIQVYLKTAVQYVSGAWVSVDTLIYQNGAWTELVVWLYKNGDESTGITGGWNAGETQGSNTVVKGKEYITVSGSNSTTARMHIVTINKVDLTAYKTLKAKVNVTERSGTNPFTLRLGYSATKTASLAAETTKTALETAATGEHEISYDISAATGSFYILFGIGWYGTAQVKKIWLE